MDVRELRIGNLVSVAGQIDPVRSIMHDGVGYQIALGTSALLIIEEEVDPIPITPELLDRFTIFEHSNDVAWWQFEEWTFGLCIEEADGLWQVNWYGAFLRYIEYIHQLQNLCFDLTGEELKLKKDVS